MTSSCCSYYKSYRCSSYDPCSPCYPSRSAVCSYIADSCPSPCSDPCSRTKSRISNFVPPSGGSSSVDRKKKSSAGKGKDGKGSKKGEGKKGAQRKGSSSAPAGGRPGSGAAANGPGGGPGGGAGGGVAGGAGNGPYGPGGGPNGPGGVGGGYGAGGGGGAYGGGGLGGGAYGGYGAAGGQMGAAGFGGYGAAGGQMGMGPYGGVCTPRKSGCFGGVCTPRKTFPNNNNYYGSPNNFGMGQPSTPLGVPNNYYPENLRYGNQDNFCMRQPYTPLGRPGSITNDYYPENLRFGDHDKAPINYGALSPADYQNFCMCCPYRKSPEANPYQNYRSGNASIQALQYPKQEPSPFPYNLDVGNYVPHKSYKICNTCGTITRTICSKEKLSNRGRMSMLFQQQNPADSPTACDSPYAQPKQIVGGFVDSSCEQPKQKENSPGCGGCYCR